MKMSFKKDKAYLLAIDPSLRQSGWALFSLQEETPVSWGILSPEKVKDPLAERLNSIHGKIERLIVELDLAAGDYLVCEGPAPVSLNPSSSIKVEQVRSMFESIARSCKLSVPGRLNPRTVQTELLCLRGKQLPRKEVKKIAQSVIYQLFSLEEGSLPQDVVDAILIGVLARSKILHAEQTGAYIGSLFEGGRGNINTRSGRGLRWNVSTGV